jgi:putative tryptophan/tyrosine transport system substrate-binding protein
MNRKTAIRNSQSAVVVCALLFAVGFPAEAQALARIGVLGAPEEPRFSDIVSGLKQGFRDLGYSEKGYEILEGRVERGKEQNSDRVVIENLARRKSQVLFVIGSRFVKPARQTAPELSVVFITPGDPVAGGLVSSLAHPGNNTTGLTFEYPELSGKRLEILKEMIPRIRRVLTFHDPRDASPTQGAAAARQAAQALGITLIDREIRSKQDITEALSAIGDAEAFLGIPGGFPTAHYQEIIRTANTRRLPTMFHAHTGSTTEALASYGASDVVMARQAARLIDKILKGANAGELPVERPTKLDLVINLKTAKQIAVSIPPNVLARAEKVIK